MSPMSPAALAERLQSGSAPQLLDIRKASEFEDWHIPGSNNIDVYDELREDPKQAKAAMAELPDDDEIVTVCGIGIRSKVATDLLEEMGYDANTLEEGLMGWSKVHRSAAVPVEIRAELIQVARPGKGCLSYILISEGEATVFDPSQYITEYEAVIDEYDAELIGVYETHAHADHVSGAADLAASHDVPHYLHADDAIAVDATPIEDDDTFAVGAVSIDVLHTPGHSPGGVTYDIEGQALLTGDTLFHESVGRVELGEAVGLGDDDVDRNAKRLYESLQLLLQRSDDQMVLPAHDPGSPEPPVIATISQVKQRNDDLGLDRSEFIARLVSDRPDLPPNVRQIKRANVGLEAIDDEDRTSIELGPNRCAAE